VDLHASGTATYSYGNTTANLGKAHGYSDLVNVSGHLFLIGKDKSLNLIAPELLVTQPKYLPTIGKVSVAKLIAIGSCTTLLSSQPQEISSIMQQREHPQDVSDMTTAVFRGALVGAVLSSAGGSASSSGSSGN
jgi:hypothetical protein